MIYAYFAGLRARLSLPVRIVLALAAAAICYLVAWYGLASLSTAIDVVLVAIAGLAAALVGFPLGALVAAVAAAIDYATRIGHTPGDAPSAIASAAAVGIVGIAVSAFFASRSSSSEEWGEADSDQMA
ncbi:MAG TPA: hypothetical protein VNG31_08345, partial [Candidatus Baltobacteraceae bacterium]|nr:hypothetical protein [Candidatus Baltobacteraceae bacterium]